jgi:polyhydroxyalkanoate synthesis regulator phasin
MVRDALSNYLTVASGLTEVTRQRARAAAKALVAQGGATVEQVGGLAEEVLQTSRANRTALVNLVRYEIENALGRLGVASAEEVAVLRQRVADLERELRDQREAGDAAAQPAESAKTAAAEPAKSAAAKSAKAPAKPARAAKQARTAKQAGAAGKPGGRAKQAAPAKKAARKAAAGGAEGRE